MRLMSTLTRLGLIFLAGAMITVLGTAEIWDEEPKEVTTLDLAETMLDVWALPLLILCLLYTSPSPRDRQKSRMPSSA